MDGVTVAEGAEAGQAAGPCWHRPFLGGAVVGSLQERAVVGDAPTPFDQDEGPVVFGAAARFLLQGVGECAHHRAYSLLCVRCG